MTRLVKSSFTLLFILAAIAGCAAQEEKTVESVYAPHDVALNMNPGSSFWKKSPSVYAEVDRNGRAVPEYRTEIRTRWTRNDIYFLFICPYKNLYLKPAPDVVHETNELWNWNVAEVFIGSDFKDIKRYKEFEVSPHNEWVDLDIDLNKPHHEDGWLWNSGFEHMTRIDDATHTWYVAMKIPFEAIDPRSPARGTMFRVNLYRTEGPPLGQREIMWQPVMSDSFHEPERFGLLRLK
ncbi:MAG TPA: carbohydrate-binding family 9-like protein [Terriglobales bacterium]